MCAAERPELRQQEREGTAALQAVAVQLSTARRAASTHLRQAVEGCLDRLAMAQSRFDVRIGWEMAGAAADGDLRVSALRIGAAAADVGALPVLHLFPVLWTGTPPDAPLVCR